MTKERTKKVFKFRIKVYVTVFSLVALILLLSACNRMRPKVDFYENLYTGEIISASDFDNYVVKLINAYSDSTNGKANVNFHLRKRTSSDSIIGSFTYSVRVGKEYLVRGDDARNQKINMKVEPQTFTTIIGDVITIGGVQDKPTMINLWFVGCRGCVKEMPVLNELQKKYADKMNFIAMTFEDKKAVEKFLRRKQFTFTHISNAENFIQYIGTSPYPESIFIDKDGYIKYIEGVISSHEGSADHFKEIIEELGSQ